MKKTQKTNSRAINCFYQNKILEQVYRFSDISREDIAEKTNLGSSIVHRNITRLKERAYIKESGFSNPAGGRKTSLFSINGEMGYLIGCSVSKDSITSILTDFSGVLIESTEKKIKSEDGYKEIINKLILSIKSLMTKKTNITAVGIGLPGLLDPQRETGIINIHVDNWRNIPIKEIICKELDIPVYLANNSELTALAEKKFGYGKGIKNFACLNISFGVGMGLIINNEIYQGVQGRAGEAGHILVDPDGPYCSCGNRGCLESMVSIPSLIKQVKHSISNGVVSDILYLADNQLDKINIETICQAMKLQDKLAMNIMKQAANTIGIVMGNIINLLNLDILVLGGEIYKGEELFLNMIEESINKIKFRHDTLSKIVYSKLACPQNMALGGVVLALDKIFIENDINLPL